MKTTIKFISTIILTIAISYSSAFACGEQGNGNKSGGEGSCLLDNNQPTVTKTNDEKYNDSQEDSIFDAIQDFLTKIFA